MEERQLEYFEQFVQKLTFSSYKQKDCIVYENRDRPELGHIIRYEKEGYYNIGVGDYTIANDFQLSFNHNETFLRFGNVYSGNTKFKMTGMEVSSFTPSSFITIESGAEGTQLWKKGQHFHGTEITIYDSYFDDVLIPLYGDRCFSLDDLPHNVTQKYLTADLIKVIHQIENISATKNFNPMLLESKILECIGIISMEYKSSSKMDIQRNYYREKIKIGNNRILSLTMQDIEIIRKAHELITENASNHLTISNISQMLHIHEQKLKAGFLHIYHMTMWEYGNSVRMTMAANLLITTDLSVDNISKRVGYASIGTFSNMFKKNYQVSPNQFRKNNSHYT
ncbi:MAG: helix-turn-helix domain-containing protein [Coprobacillaceae bacterium]